MAISSVEDFKKKKKEKQEELELDSGLTVLVEKPGIEKVLRVADAENPFLQELLSDEEVQELQKQNEENLEKVEKHLDDKFSKKYTKTEQAKMIFDFHKDVVKATLVKPEWKEVNEYLDERDIKKISDWALGTEVGVERFQE